MAITALPATTVRLLNSAQVLTTPASLVKELVDNAIDAKATSVDILISPNTLDKVEVRDNGHGILPEDLDVLARHGHTSKLRSFEELKFLGGLTLGFRGEALASAVELGEVQVTTKTEGESVGTTVKLKAVGGIDHQTRTSHPVGTTVSVKNFMAKLPVRKKTFEKEASKTVAAITRLLQAYALARPAIRLSLKISNGGKGSWSFIPHPSGDIREAVLRAIGRDIAMQCVHTVVPSKYDDHTTEAALALETSGTKLENFVIQAFLPSPHADPSKIIGGQYLSVDSRPVSHSRGTMKKIVTTFKTYVQNLPHDTDGKVKSPFIRLNIKCPVASYDANIEPSKDEVLFWNEDRLLETVESLFKSVYGELGTPAPRFTPQLSTEETENVEGPVVRGSELTNHAIEQHFERESASEITFSKDISRLDHPISPKDNDMIADKYGAIDGVQSNKTSRWGFDISEDLSIDVEGNDTRRNVYQRSYPIEPYTTRQTRPGQESLQNPWTIAKTASVPTTRLVSSPKTSSSITKPGPARLHTLPLTSSLAQQPSTPSQNARPGSSERHQLYFNAEHDLSLADRRQSLQLTRKNDFVSARSVVLGTLISPPPTQPSKSSANTRVLKPFHPLLLGSHDTTGSDGLRQTRIVPVHQLSPAGTDDQQTSTNSELAWAMDFENRKEEASRRRREEIRAMRAMHNDPATTKSARSSPHKNRYNSAAASLNEDLSSLHTGNEDQGNTPFQTCLPDDDPRAYFMRRRRSMALEASTPRGPPKLVRAKSAKLPLESIPGQDQLQNFIQVLPVDNGLLRQVAVVLEKYDLPTDEFSGLTPGSGDVSIVLQRLQTVISAKMMDRGDEHIDIDNIFSEAVLQSIE